MGRYPFCLRRVYLIDYRLNNFYCICREHLRPFNKSYAMNPNLCYIMNECRYLNTLHNG